MTIIGREIIYYKKTTNKIANIIVTSRQINSYNEQINKFNIFIIQLYKLVSRENTTLGF